MPKETQEGKTGDAPKDELAVALKDSRLRSVIKGLTWRIIATLTTITIALVITGEVDAALRIGGIEFLAKFLIYYAHERAWAKIPLGTIRRIVT